jgi:hypothetical protein
VSEEVDLLARKGGINLGLEFSSSVFEGVERREAWRKDSVACFPQKARDPMEVVDGSVLFAGSEAMDQDERILKTEGVVRQELSCFEFESRLLRGTRKGRGASKWRFS